MIRCSSSEDKRADPDVVLEARAELWNVDRITHALTSSDVLVGEDGNEDFLASEVPYDSVSVRLNQPPLRSVSIDGTVNWTQAGKGAFDVKRNAHFLTYTGDGLISDWPKTGASLGGGWEVVDGRAADAAGIERFPDDYFQIAGSFSAQPFPDDWLVVKTIHWEFVDRAEGRGRPGPAVGRGRHPAARLRRRAPVQGARPLHPARQRAADRDLAGRR